MEILNKVLSFAEQQIRNAKDSKRLAKANKLKESLIKKIQPWLNKIDQWWQAINKVVTNAMNKAWEKMTWAINQWYKDNRSRSFTEWAKVKNTQLLIKNWIDPTWLSNEQMEELILSFNK